MEIKESAARVREPAAWVLLAVLFIVVVAGVVRVLMPGAEAFGQAQAWITRAYYATHYFLNPFAAAAPGVAVVLATVAGKPLARARAITLIAIVASGFVALLGFVSLVLSIAADVPAVWKVPDALFGVTGLAVLTVGIMVGFAALRADELKPAPKPQQAYAQYGYGHPNQQFAAYGYGQPGQPGQAWYGEQQPQYQQYAASQQYAQQYPQGQYEQYQQAERHQQTYGAGHPHQAPYQGQEMGTGAEPYGGTAQSYEQPYEQQQPQRPAYEPRQPAYQQEHQPYDSRYDGHDGPYGQDPYGAQQPDEYRQPTRPDPAGENAEHGRGPGDQRHHLGWHGQPPQ